MRKALLFLLMLLPLAVPAQAQVTITYSFTAGTIIDPDQMNANFTALGSAALNRTGGTVTGAIASSGGSLSGSWAGTFGVTGTAQFDADALHLADTNASHYLILTPGTNLTANRVLTLTTGDAARTVTLSGDPTLGDWFDQSVKVAASPTFAGLTVSGATASFRGVPYTMPSNDGDASQVLQSNGSGTLSWATVASKVVQIVTATYNTQATSSTNVYADTGLTASITPTSSSNKVLVVVFQNGVAKETCNTEVGLKLLRGASELAWFAKHAANTGTLTSNFVGTVGTVYLDSPATTSATTYKTTFNSGGSCANAYTQYNGEQSSIFLAEVTP